jgi:uncharacterized protein YsxB (DUF464 family)
MITIEIFYAHSKITRMRVTGHALAALHGKDIICAGVSALTQSAVLGLQDYLERKLALRVAAGELDCALDGAPDDLSEAIWQTMLLGLIEIAKINPKRVQIKEHRR